MARPIVLIPHLFRLADAIKFRKDYSPPSSPPSRPYTCAMQFTNAMYSFLQEPFFPTGFLDGVFNKTCAYRGNRPRRSVVKHTDSILEEKEKVQS